MILRRLAAGILAVPVFVATVLATSPRRRIAARLGIAAAIVATAAAASVALVPRSGNASPQTPIEPVPAALFSPLLTDRSLDAPARITFTSAMDKASVKAALDVAPPAAVKLSWDSTARIVTIAPATNWQAGTAYDITVGTAATNRAGKALKVAAHALFLTRAPTSGRLDAKLTSAGLLRADGTISLTFERPVNVVSAQNAFTIQPAVAGTLLPSANGKTSAGFTFTPTSSFAGSTSYTVGVNGTVVDADGGTIAGIPPLQLTTVPSAAIVRSRPSGGAKSVPATALLSVRFTVPMDRASTAKALSVTVGGKAVAGALAWSEKDTVLAFDPTKSLPAGSTIRFAVTTSARSADGAPLTKPLGITFTVARPAAPASKPAATKPASAAPAPKPSGPPAPKPVAPPSSGGSAAGSAPWYAVETYVLRLMNCTRTGGWVTSGGACGSVPSGLTVKPPATALVLDAGISTKVTRPYAKYLAVNGLCNHFYDGSPGDRLRRAGYTSYRWGENIGCPYGDPNAGMIAVERFFQNETPSGGHYVNLMNPQYDRAGIGVWVASSRVRVVIDFYHP